MNKTPHIITNFYQRLMNLRNRRFSLAIIVCASAMLILVNAITFDITSAVRAYVNGESLYSKGQKDGTRYLLMYLTTRDSQYWRCFHNALEIPLGDSLARVALMSRDDEREALRGFLQGKNNEADAKEMIWLFRNFKDVSFMKRAIQTWKEADALMGDLVRLGHEIHANANTLSGEETKILITRIEKVSARLTVKETEFSEGLGEAARAIDQRLFYINIFFTVMIIGCTGHYSSFMIRRLSSANDKLKRTLDFAGLSSGTIDFKKKEIRMSSELLNILDMNPRVPSEIKLNQLLKNFVSENDQAEVYRKFYEAEQQGGYPGEIEMEFEVKTIKKKTKTLRLKALAIEGKGYAVVEDITARKKMEKALKVREREEERKRLANLIEGQEIERARLSREMHDGLGQLLNAIQFNLECLSHENLVPVRDRVGKLIHETLSESKRISCNLLPLKLIDFDLSTCVSSLCEHINSEKVKVVFQTKPYHLEHSGQEKLTLYRIIQEGIQNAIKHSGCSQIFVQLYVDDQGIHISVEDDGKGFDKTQIQDSSYGLRNIRHRIEVLNGKLEIESSPEFGTLLSVTVPITQNVTV